ncbi:MAG: phospho-sugar mutase [Frankia sp.]
MRDELHAAVAGWIRDDPDERDRSELTALLDRGDDAALADRFAGRLAFGTAGLRGPLRAGPNGMNVAVVRQTAAGIAAYLREHADDHDRAPVVVIGYDARHRSATFATDSAGVFTAAGCRALVLPRPLPTPVLAFAVRHLGADAGIMVTASHNPAADNGYKVYLGGPPAPAGDGARVVPAADNGNQVVLPADSGAQIVPPADVDIEAAIGRAAAGPARGIPLADGWERLGNDLVEAYVTAAAATAAPDAPRDVAVAYTPIHGVGADVLAAVFARAGFAAPAVVPEQARPDPDFPTAPFPNPEEPGVLDPLLRLASATGADIAIANDPDADRCAVAVGGRVLTGDELGVLLADHVLGRHPGPVATTIVSSSWLGHLARSRGGPYAETLTGFKWIVRSYSDLVFGYEEALGYCVAPDLVRDKDGITAALAVAELAATEKARGRTLLDRLDDLAREAGPHVTTQIAVRVDDVATISTLMAALRAAPPGTFGPDEPVTAVVDFAAGRPTADGLALPPSDVLLFQLARGGKVVIRPSGTEPKLKAYLETADETPGHRAIDGSAADRMPALRSAVGELLRALIPTPLN